MASSQTSARDRRVEGGSETPDMEVISSMDFCKANHNNRHTSEASSKWKQKLKSADANGGIRLAIKLEKVRKEKTDCHFCQLESYKTHSKFPVTIFNDVDDESLPTKFKFIEHTIFCNGIEPAPPEFRVGCDCENNFSCLYDRCSCLQDMTLRGYSTEDGRMFAYQSVGPLKGCLRPRILQTADPIYECHSGCSCNSDCYNRVIERGRQIPLEIFKTKNRGWGLRSPVDIRRGQFVDKYIGEAISPEEAETRRAKSSITQRKDIYLFALDKFTDPENLDERLRGPPVEIDGEFKSGPTRFINHSCEPNLKIFARVGDYADKHLHDLAFFALRDIKAGEELTFDYTSGMESDFKEAKDKKVANHMTKCLCGAKKCRGYLW